MTMQVPDDFKARALNRETIQLECSVPEGASSFEWQYTTVTTPTENDWIVYATTNEYGVPE